MHQRDYSVRLQLERQFKMNKKITQIKEETKKKKMIIIRERERERERERREKDKQGDK